MKYSLKRSNYKKDTLTYCKLSNYVWSEENFTKPL